jgi:hypothetical protein
VNLYNLGQFQHFFRFWLAIGIDKKEKQILYYVVKENSNKENILNCKEFVFYGIGF